MQFGTSALRILALAGALTLAACGGDDDGNGPGSQGSFDLAIDGDLQGESNGAAGHGVSDDPETPGFAFAFVDAAEEGVLILYNPDLQAAPAAGVRNIGDALGEIQENTFYGTLTTFDAQGPTALFVSTGGTLTITRRGGDVLEGSFELTMAGGTFEDPETTLEITVEGTFDSREVMEEQIASRVREAARAALRAAK